MATRSTRKKQQFDKKELAKKLNTISENVSKRGAHVVVQHDGLYNVLEALKKTVVLHSIPRKTLAQALCVRLNQPKTSRFAPVNTTAIARTQKYILQYCDLVNQTVFYKHTIQVTKDDFRREVAFVRLDEAVSKGKYILSKIKGML